MKHSDTKQKPITGKKITYSSTINEKSPKATRQANQFELIYKIKNRQNQNLEDSYQSMIMLKSKNKIKRFRYGSDKDREKDRQKEKSKNQSTNIKEVFDRINNKIQQHSKKTSPRLINLLSMSSGSPRSHIVVDQRINSKRNKEKSKNKIEKVDMISSRPNNTKNQKILRKVRKHIESHIAPKQPSPRNQTQEYIMFDGQIHPIAQQTHKNLTSLMKSTYDKSKLSLNHLYLPDNECEQSIEKQEYQQECQDEYQMMYQHSATQIQKIWRGYYTRKMLNQQKQQVPNKQDEEEKVNDIKMQTSVNGMFIELFQQIVDLDQQDSKVELLKAFRDVLNKNKSNTKTISSKTITSKQQTSISQKRQQAIQALFHTQSNILKYLLITQTITEDDYMSRLQDLTKWGSLKRDQITKLHRTIEQINQKTEEIISQTYRMNQAFEQVEAKKSSPQILTKCFQQVQKQLLSYSFYESQHSRQSSIAHHLPTENNEPSEIKTIVEQIQSRQSIKNYIEKRMLQQLGYFNAETSPVNTSNIGIHIFLTDILNFIEEYYRDDFLRWINMPYGYSSESRLKLLQGYDVKVTQQTSGLVEGVQNVLSLQILLQYHRQTYNPSELYNIYHQRAIFDAFNQCLNVYRPYYSIKGPPYAWNNSEKALTFYFIAEENIEEVFEKTKQQILKHASNLCGILSEQPQVSKPLTDLINLKHGCHEMIAQCRDEKLTKMEHQIVLSNEGDWSLLEEQKTQTMLNLSEMLLSQIIRQLAKDIILLSR